MRRPQQLMTAVRDHHTEVPLSRATEFFRREAPEDRNFTREMFHSDVQYGMAKALRAAGIKFRFKSVELPLAEPSEMATGAPVATSRPAFLLNIAINGVPVMIDFCPGFLLKPKKRLSRRYALTMEIYGSEYHFVLMTNSEPKRSRGEFDFSDRSRPISHETWLVDWKELASLHVNPVRKMVFDDTRARVVTEQSPILGMLGQLIRKGVVYA